jgi:hypothetical protein
VELQVHQVQVVLQELAEVQAYQEHQEQVVHLVQVELQV